MPISLRVMALSLPLFMIVLLAGCFDGPSPYIIIEIGEGGALQPRFIANYDIRSLSVYHVYGWPRVTPADETPDGEPVWRESLMWSVTSEYGSRVKSIEYGKLPSGYKESVPMPLIKNRLYVVEFYIEIGGPSCPVSHWFCILEDETGEARLIELTFRASRHSDLDPPFNEVRLELEEGTGKILKIIPVE